MWVSEDNSQESVLFHHVVLAIEGRLSGWGQASLPAEPSPRPSKHFQFAVS